MEEKIRFGDLEIDRIIGKDHQGAIVKIINRASVMLKMKKVKNRTIEDLSLATEELLIDWIPYINTITSGNGKEFAMHQSIAETLNVEFYFAKHTNLGKEEQTKI